MQRRRGLQGRGRRRPHQRRRTPICLRLAGCARRPRADGTVAFIVRASQSPARRLTPRVCACGALAWSRRGRLSTRAFERACEHPAARTRRRPARASDRDAGPARVGRTGQPTNDIAAHEISKRGAARRIAQIHVVGVDDRRPRRGAHAAQRTPIAMPAARIRPTAIEIGARGAARKLAQPEIWLKVGQQHPAGLARRRRHAVPPHEPADRSPQRWSVQAAGIAGRLTPKMPTERKLDRPPIASDNGRARARPHAQHRRADRAPRLIGHVDPVCAVQAARQRHSTPTRSIPINATSTTPPRRRRSICHASLC